MPELQDEGAPVPGAPHTVVNFVGAGVEVSDAGGGVADVRVNATVLVFRPGAVGAEAEPDNVFTDWALLMAELDATQDAGIRFLEFDNRFAPNPATDPVLTPFLPFNVLPPISAGFPYGGLWPCAIPPPPPGQAWNMRDVVWIDRTLPPGFASMRVQIWDGGPGRPCLIDNIKRIEMMLLDLIYNGLTPGNHPFVATRWITAPDVTPGAFGPGFNAFGVRFRAYNTNAAAQPMWLSNTGSFWDLRNDSTIGVLTADALPGLASLPAPIIEVPAVFNAILYDQGQIANNAFVGGGTVRIRTHTPANNDPRDPNGTFVFPSFTGALLGEFTPGNRYRPWVTSQSWPPNTTVLTANGPAFMGEVTRVNTAAGPVVVTLPRARVTPPTTGIYPWQGAAITIVDISGTAGANSITIRATVGDSINGNAELGGGESDIFLNTNHGSLRVWNDGSGNWYVIT